MTEKRGNDCDVAFRTYSLSTKFRIFEKNSRIVEELLKRKLLNLILFYYDIYVYITVRSV